MSMSVLNDQFMSKSSGRDFSMSRPPKCKQDASSRLYLKIGSTCVQEAMRAAEKAGTEECPVKMKLLAPPLYVLTTNTLEKNKGIEVLNAACQIAKTTVETRKGRLLVKEAARAVSERDDRLLNETVSSCLLAKQLRCLAMCQ